MGKALRVLVGGCVGAFLLFLLILILRVLLTPGNWAAR